MNRFLMACLLGGFVAPAAWAQQGSVPVQLPTRAPTPALSPYLLLSPNNGNGFLGGNAAINYYNLVQPAFQNRAFQQNTNATLLNLERVAQSSTLQVPDLLPTLPTTGHIAVFNNTGGYFTSTGVNRPSFTPLAPSRR